MARGLPFTYGPSRTAPKSSTARAMGVIIELYFFSAIRHVGCLRIERLEVITLSCIVKCKIVGKVLNTVATLSCNPIFSYLLRPGFTQSDETSHRSDCDLCGHNLQLHGDSDPWEQ